MWPKFLRWFRNSSILNLNIEFKNVLTSETSILVYFMVGESPVKCHFFVSEKHLGLSFIEGLYLTDIQDMLEYIATVGECDSKDKALSTHMVMVLRCKEELKKDMFGHTALSFRNEFKIKKHYADCVSKLYGYNGYHKPEQFHKLLVLSDKNLLNGI